MSRPHTAHAYRRVPQKCRLQARLAHGRRCEAEPGGIATDARRLQNACSVKRDRTTRRPLECDPASGAGSSYAPFALRRDPALQTKRTVVLRPAPWDFTLLLCQIRVTERAALAMTSACHGGGREGLVGVAEYISSDFRNWSRKFPIASKGLTMRGRSLSKSMYVAIFCICTSNRCSGTGPRARHTARSGSVAVEPDPVEAERPHELAHAELCIRHKTPSSHRVLLLLLQCRQLLSEAALAVLPEPDEISRLEVDMAEPVMLSQMVADSGLPGSRDAGRLEADALV